MFHYYVSFYLVFQTGSEKRRPFLVISAFCLFPLLLFYTLNVLSISLLVIFLSSFKSSDSETPYRTRIKTTTSVWASLHPTQDCKSVSLAREREREGLELGTNGGWEGENGNGAAKVAGAFEAGNAASETTVTVAELGQGTPEGGVLTFIRRVLPTLLHAGPAPPARRHGAASSGGRAPRERVVVEDRASCKANQQLGGGEPEFENGWRR